jgi:GNAT superfamily N-acetyltransferase
VSRPQVSVRLLDEAHQGDLVDLWLENRVESGGGTEAALRVASLQRTEVTAFLAFVEDTAVGYVVLKDSLAGPLTDSPCTSIDQLFVSTSWRRHGVARQLLAAAAAHADRVGAEAIVSHVPSQIRDANRFFARLGFSPTVVRRVTTPAALHRKLAASVDTPVLRRVGLEEVIQRRRSARFRAVRQGTATHATDL